MPNNVKVPPIKESQKAYTKIMIIKLNMLSTSYKKINQRSNRKDKE